MHQDETTNTLPQTPFKTITSSSHVEVIELDFLQLNTCAGGFQYLLVITDNFKFTPQGKKSQKQQVPSYLMIKS